MENTFLARKRQSMTTIDTVETRIALIGIIVNDDAATNKLNSILSSYRQYIVGRMGIPYHQKNISIISVIIDAPNDVISALSGSLGNLEGVNTKTLYAKVGELL